MLERYKNNLKSFWVRLIIFVLIVVSLWHVSILAFQWNSNVWLHVVSAFLMFYLAWELKRANFS